MALSDNVVLLQTLVQAQDNILKLQCMGPQALLYVIRQAQHLFSFINCYQTIYQAYVINCYLKISQSPSYLLHSCLGLLSPRCLQYHGLQNVPRVYPASSTGTADMYVFWTYKHDKSCYRCLLYCLNLKQKLDLSSSPSELFVKHYLTTLQTLSYQVINFIILGYKPYPTRL